VCDVNKDRVYMYHTIATIETCKRACS